MRFLGNKKVWAAALAAVWGLALSAAPVWAEGYENELAPGFNKCLMESGGVTSNMNDCYNNAIEYHTLRIKSYQAVTPKHCEQLFAGEEDVFTEVQKCKDDTETAFQMIDPVLNIMVKAAAQQVGINSPVGGTMAGLEVNARYAALVKAYADMLAPAANE